MNKVLLPSLLLANFLLTAYLVHLLKEEQANTAETMRMMQHELGQNYAMLAGQKKDLENLLKQWAEQEKARKEKIERDRQQEMQKQLLQGLQTALTSLGQADALKQRGDMSGAVALLLAIKEPVWKAGDAFPAQKDNLQGLMPLIDGLTNRWKAGDKNGGSEAIRERLQNALKVLGK